MQQASTTHLVLIPSYNSGDLVYHTVRAARTQWNPVWVVVDGSNDGTAEVLLNMAAVDSALKILILAKNCGKGAAILYGLNFAMQQGFTHVLCMDADGQHPTYLIPKFMDYSQAQPEAMILGMPVFDASAPILRVKGRKISNWWANLETLWMGIGDSLCGFRVYPIVPLQRIMQKQRWMRRFDFDPEAAVRLCWAGVHPINLKIPVKYLLSQEGGVSHFHYLRDNTLLVWMHIRLMCNFILKLPYLFLKIINFKFKNI